MEDEEFLSRPLKGYDYINRSVSELATHPDFSAHAMRVISAILEMSTNQIEEITIVRGTH